MLQNNIHYLVEGGVEEMSVLRRERDCTLDGIELSMEAELVSSGWF